MFRLHGVAHGSAIEVFHPRLGRWYDMNVMHRSLKSNWNMVVLGLEWSLL